MTADTAAESPPLIIASHGGEEIAARLRAHHSQPTVIEADLTSPWDVPQDATVLVTRGLARWKHAPDQPPPGWPHRLRWVQTQSVGIDFYPRWLVETLPVSVGRGLTADPIAEYVIAALLHFEKRFDRLAVRSVEQWVEHRLGELQGKTLGLLGYGAVGQAIARRAAALGMRVLAVRRSRWQGTESEVVPIPDAGSLFEQSDHLVIAMPSTADNYRFVNAALLARAKRGMHLVNIARGTLLDQEALADALEEGAIAGATLDVTDPEPLPTGHRLYTAPNLVITPHLSWYSAAFETRFESKLHANLDRYLNGEPLLDLFDSKRGY